MEIKRGDIFFADLSPALGAEMGGMRYVVIIQSDKLNDEVSSKGGTVLVAPLTSSKVEVGAYTSQSIMTLNIPELSLFQYQALLCGARAIDIKRLKNHIGRLNPEDMAEFNEKLKFALSI